MTQPESTYLEMISVVGHELRRPLTVIRGAATLMLDADGGLPPESALQMLHMIDSNVEVMSDLIEDLLLMVHIEAGDLRMFVEPLTVADLVAEAVEAQRGHSPQLAVTVLGAAPSVRVEADRQRVTRAIRALLDNAATHPPVEVAVDAADSEVRIAVRDRGPGLAALTPDEAFRRYGRGPESTGLGLGLYLVRGVAQGLGGDAGIAERRDGGVEAWITLRRRG